MGTSESALHSLRLPFRFDVTQLRADVRKVHPGEWVSHYNTSDFEGRWSGVAFRSKDGTTGHLQVGLAKQGFADTPLLERCGYIREVLAVLAFPHNAVRLLRLHAGSVIREHADPALGFEDGEVRIHIPIETDPQVLFYLDGRRMPLAPGEAWYLDLRRPHRVENRSSADRVHLVIDGRVNAWVCSVFEAARQTTPPVLPAETSPFDHFRERVWMDCELQSRLLATPDQAAFIALTVRAGGEYGCAFSNEAVEAAIRAGRRAWNSRGFEG